MLPPVRVHPRRAVRLEHRDMRAEPGGVPAPGRKPPPSGDSDAAVDGDAAPGPWQIRPPGEDAARRPEDLAVEENHVSWAHMYRMMFVAQIGFALAYLL